MNERGINGLMLTLVGLIVGLVSIYVNYRVSSNKMVLFVMAGFGMAVWGAFLLLKKEEKQLTKEQLAYLQQRQYHPYRQPVQYQQPVQRQYLQPGQYQQPIQPRPSLQQAKPLQQYILQQEALRRQQQTRFSK